MKFCPRYETLVLLSLTRQGDSFIGKGEKSVGQRTSIAAEKKRHGRGHCLKNSEK
ncbi:MAG: hypothetical protein LBF38_05430 [Deltaproteobacteria bacterium]|nr:hypothetical protein [Deltaproteobacteria bacterium]